MTTKSVNKFSSNLISLYFLQLFNYIAPFMILPLLTRVIPVEEFGAVMIAISLVQVAFVITDYGFSSSAVADISRNTDFEYVNNKISKVFSAKIPLILICVLLMFCVAVSPSFSAYSLIFYSAIGAVIAQAFQPVWFFHGLQKMKLFTIYMAATKLLHVALVILFVDSAGDGFWVLVSWSISNTLGALISLVMVKRLGYSISFASTFDGLKELAHNVQFFLSRLAVASYTNASSFLVGAVDMSQAANYAAAEQGYKAGQSVSAPVAQALYPLMAKDANWKLFFRMLLLVFLLLGLGGVFVSYFAGYIVEFVFGIGYLDVVPILQIFMATMVVNFFGLIFGYPACSAIDRIYIANISVMIGSSVYFIGAVCLYMNDIISALSIAMLIFIVESLIVIIRCMWIIFSTVSWDEKLGRFECGDFF